MKKTNDLQLEFDKLAADRIKRVKKIFKTLVKIKKECDGRTDYAWEMYCSQAFDSKYPMNVIDFWIDKYTLSGLLPLELLIPEESLNEALAEIRIMLPKRDLGDLVKLVSEDDFKGVKM
jgi:hypothetical protein